MPDMEIVCCELKCNPKLKLIKYLPETLNRIGSERSDVSDLPNLFIA